MAEKSDDDAVIRIKPVRIIKQPAFNQENAQFYVDLGLSGDDTMDWILGRCYPHLRPSQVQDVPVIDWNGSVVDFDRVFIEEMFGADPRRYINAYKKRAVPPLSRQRLHNSCIGRVTYMDVARQMELLLRRIAGSEGGRQRD